MNSNSRSFARSYDNRKENKEGIPLERFLEKRKLHLSEWLSQNKIKSVIEAEEKVKSLGICITKESLNQLVNFFEVPIEKIEEQTELPPLTPPDKPKKKKSLEELPTATS